MTEPAKPAGAFAQPAPEPSASLAACAAGDAGGLLALPGAAAWVHGAACLSGIAGLGYELLWTRLLAVSLGHEVVAVLAVLAAFFVGLSLGSWLLGPRIVASQRPQRWFVGLELLIGGWALCLLPLIPAFNRWMPALLGARPTPAWHWVIAFGSTLLLLLPATAAMGGTLPALERTLVRQCARPRGVAGLYAANTFGAVLGTCGSAFLLAPRLGYSATLWLLALCNGLGVLAMGWGLRSTQRQPEVPPSAAPVGATRPRPWSLWLRLLAVGWLGIGYEVVAVRLLGQVLTSTVYTFAILLAVYLLGTALGAALWQRCAPRLQGMPPSQVLRWLLAGVASSCLLGACGLWWAPQLWASLDSLQWAPWGREWLLGALVFIAPTVATGALFAELMQRAPAQGGMGPALAVNTLGSALAPLCFGLWLLPALGAKWSLLLIAFGYLVLQPAPTRGLPWLFLAPSAGLSALLVLASPLRYLTVPEGGEVLVHREGVMAAVAVVSDGAGERWLKVNDHFTMGGTASAFSDQRQTHLPLLWHGDPSRALFLGVGTGMTLSAVKNYPGLHSTAVELVPELLDLLPYFGTEPDQDWLEQPELLAADARRFVLASEAQYDVIIAELFHPWKDGAAALYTLEHFSALRGRLAADGLFCQWLPLYQLDLGTLRTIIRTFLAAFPHVQVHLGHFSLAQPILALVGSERPRPAYVQDWLESRVTERRLQRQLVELRLNSDLALFGGLLGEREALATFAGPGPLNRDDWPVVAFAAPELMAVVEQQPPAERLLALVAALAEARQTDGAQEQVQGTDFGQRMAAYWSARDAFLFAGEQVVPSLDPARMAAQIQAPLLKVLKMSPEFAPAYAPLLGLARGLYARDPAAAQALLVAMAEVSPGRPEARVLYRRLFGDIGEHK